MKLITTIEIDEVETQVLIHYSAYFSNIEIEKITEIETGDAICPDLLDKKISDDLYSEINELESDRRAERSCSRFNYDF
jgi:hypothetical protein